MADSFKDSPKWAQRMRYGAPKAGALDDIADAYRQAFGFSAERTAQYVHQVDLQNFRVLRIDDQVVAVLALLETGHWLGGKPVPAINIAHVAINPQWRGIGLAGRFLGLTYDEANERGIGLVTLFASTRPVYRRSGFALAGTEAIYEAEMTSLPRHRGAAFSRVTGSQARVHLAKLYRDRCAAEAGLLDRAEAHWAAVLAGDVAVYFSEVPEAPAYLVLDTSEPGCLLIRDWTALNGAGAQNILSFIGTFGSVFPRVRWHGSTEDALIYALPDKGWRLVHQEEWLAKVIDVPRVLESRGYHCDDAEVGIDLVTDTGTTPLDLTVHAGTGECRPRLNAAPTIEIAQSEFATLLTGHRSASFLARAGIIKGEARAIRLCDSIFNGPPPYVGEHF